jgi:stearoyl-CoA desaturase (delta-9 desaturase)
MAIITLVVITVLRLPANGLTQFSREGLRYNKTCRPPLWNLLTRFPISIGQIHGSRCYESQCSRHKIIPTIFQGELVVSRHQIIVIGRDMNQLDVNEVNELSNFAYACRVLYFSVTSLIVIAGTIIAVKEFISSPLDILYVVPITFPMIALGINTGYHMYFTHKAFDAPPTFKVILAYLASIACQDSITQWVVNHKRHHRYTDIVDLDPHTPRQFGDNKLTKITLGLVWASGIWKYSRSSTSKDFYGRQLLSNPLINWIDKYFVAISYSGFIIPFLLGYAFGDINLAVKWFAYFGAFRVFAGYFFTEVVVNGLCHIIGLDKFYIKGHSRNLDKVSWVTLGTTFHHNHHAFPRALSAAVDGERDTMNLIYLPLEILGAIKNRYAPSKEEVDAKKIGAVRGGAKEQAAHISYKIDSKPTQASCIVAES